MPIPKPKKGEKQKDFISRCIEFETKAAPGRDKEQVAAMCYQAWRDRQKEGYATQEASTASWGTVDKSKLPAACFLWVEDPAKKSTWHLPV